MEITRNTNDQGDIVLKATANLSGERQFVMEIARIRSLYTLAWLVTQDRMDDARDYRRSRDPKYEDECGLALNFEDEVREEETGQRLGATVSLRIPPSHSPVVAATMILVLEQEIRF